MSGLWPVCIWDMWELLWAREWTSKQDKKWRTANSKMKIIILSNSNSRGIITNLKLWVQIFDSPHKPRVQIWSFNMINSLIKRCCNTFVQNGVCNAPLNQLLLCPWIHVRRIILHTSEYCLFIQSIRIQIYCII